MSSKRIRKKKKGHTSTLLNICPLNLIRDIFKPFKDRGHTLVSTNLHHDPRYCRVYHTEKRKNDQVGNDHEEKVSSGHCTVQAGTCGGSLVLGDFADDDRKKEAKEGGDDGWEDTRNHGKLDSRLSKWIYQPQLEIGMTHSPLAPATSVFPVRKECNIDCQ